MLLLRTLFAETSVPQLLRAVLDLKLEELQLSKGEDRQEKELFVVV